MWIKLLHCQVGGGSVRDRLYLRNLNTIFIALIKFGAFFFKFLRAMVICNMHIILLTTTIHYSFCMEIPKIFLSNTILLYNTVSRQYNTQCGVGEW